MKKKLSSPLFLTSVENILEQALKEILSNLKASYSDSSDSIVYVTICSDKLVNSIRSGTYHLKENTLDGLVNHIMSSFNRYLNSNQDLQLDNSFSVYFKVLSSDSINYHKHRRKTVPFRGLVGSNGGSKTFLPGGILDLTASFPKKNNSLKDVCLISSVIYSYLEFADSLRFAKLAKMCLAHSSQKFKNQGAEILSDEIKRFSIATGVPEVGPHDYSVISKLAEYYQIQIHLILSMDNARKVSKISFPEKNDLNRHRVYLFENKPNHVVLIKNLTRFVNFHKRNICFDCGNFYSNFFKRNVHRCHGRVNCDKCLSCFETKETIKVPNEPTFFCDSKLKAETKDRLCLKCNFSFKTDLCFELHEHACQQNRLRVKCNNCDVYFLNHSPKALEEFKSKHICGVWLTRCQFCLEEHNKEDYHLCKIRTEVYHHIWPNLGFINMQFTQNSYGNCQSCFLIRDKYRREHNLSFQELFVCKEFETLICDQHQSISFKNDLPNLVSLFCEETRFVFKQHFFVDNSNFLTYAKEEIFNWPYCDNPPEMTPEVFQEKRCVKTMTKKFYEYLEKVSVKNLALDNFFKYLFNRENCLSNYTFIVETNMSMFAILRYILSLQVTPQVIQTESTINLIEVSSLRLRFLLRTAYLKGTSFEIGQQYSVDFKKTFFPASWNNCKNYNYVGRKPSFCDYQLFNDSIEDVKEQQLFYAELSNDNWNFNEQIMTHFQNETLVAVTAVLKFLQEAFRLQTILSEVTGKDPSAIHPFNGRVTSLSGFSYAVFHFYYLNDVESYTVSNPDVAAGRTQTSRPEFEYIAWLNFKTGNFIRGTFSSPTGQKFFGKHSVDGYDEKNKIVYQFRG